MVDKPQLPCYSWWDQVPAQLMTRSALGLMGFKPGGPVRAEISYGSRPVRRYDLYSLAEARRKQATAAQLAALAKGREKQRTCKYCGKLVESSSDLSPKGRCPECMAAYRRRKRAKEIDTQIRWARGVLANPTTVFLDTETTDLHGRICEIGIVDREGNTVYESLINPRSLWQFEAEFLHGISRRMCLDAPTFADIEPELRKILHGRLVIIYNAAYDTDVIESELRRMAEPSAEAEVWLIERYHEPFKHATGDTRYWPNYRDRGEREAYQLAQEHATWWMSRAIFQCAMDHWSTYIGEWDNYHRGYRYRALGGEHRAIGDARACLDVVRLLASKPLSTEETPIPSAPFAPQ